ncbi:hypothetical protein MRX96_022924 [Rhipicephalus microplus]
MKKTKSVVVGDGGFFSRSRAKEFEPRLPDGETERRPLPGVIPKRESAQEVGGKRPATSPERAAWHAAQQSLQSLVWRNLSRVHPRFILTVWQPCNHVLRRTHLGPENNPLFGQ